MYISEENQLWYPDSWNYNAARLMTVLATIVEDHGGRVQYDKKSRILNRSLMNIKKELQERLERAKNSNGVYKDKAIERLSKELEELQGINHEPITVTHTTYIRFVLDGYVYYYQVDENPFFPFSYEKTPLVKGKYSRDACLVEDKKEWLYGGFFGYRCSQEDIVEGRT